jgi:uncharacterized protein YabN with tetrapyrrole methylase and pyrophosphatase domain
MSASPGDHADRDRRPDIYVIGTGIVGVWQLTREAEACLRRSRECFLVDPGYGVGEHIAALGPRVHNLIEEYQEGGNRIDTYRQMSARVVAAALDEPPVSLAVYGHPTLFVYPTTLIREAAKHLGLEVEVVAGISSLDTMLIDLDLEPGMNGLQLYDANAILVERRRLDNEVPCLLLQVDAVESAFHSEAPSRPSRFQRLRDHLLQFYPEDHLVTSVRSASFPIFEPQLVDFELGSLPKQMAERRLGGTLYVPPASHAEFDERLAREIYDPFHLTRITYRSG